MPESEPARTTPEQRRGMVLAVFAQCCGGFSALVFKQGLALLYLLQLGLPEGRALVYISFTTLANFSGVLFAHWADRLGLKRVGFPGLILASIGSGLLPAAALVPAGWLREAVVVLGILSFAIGGAALAGTWFPLLRPLIPDHLRGRFFGILRFSWQLVGVGFIAGCAAVLAHDDSLATYAWLMVGVTVGQVLRVIVYARIPEMAPPDADRKGLAAGIRAALVHPGYLPLLAYVFLLALTTAGAGMCFTLAESRTMQLPDSTVVLLGNLSLVGGVLGFVLGGMVVDRWGARSVFVIAHIGAALLLSAFVARGWSPLPLMVWLGAIHVCLGGLLSAVSVAVTTEQMAVLPDRSRGVALAMATSGSMVGGGLSGMLAAALVGSGMLASEWGAMGVGLGPYDAVLAIFAGAVLVLVITLGLVPSVLSGRHQLLPE